MPFDYIQLLDTSVIHQLRSSLVITSITQCVKELIHNALDAKAENIDIFLDIEKFTVQVNDDGFGIQNLNRIGQRHVTSKCHSLSDIKELKTFGYRGEALAAIANESLTQIISKHYLSNDTFEGFWRDGKMVGEIYVSKHTRKIRSGTNVIVRDLFYKFPVRRRQITSASSYQHIVILESVKRLITTFAILFPHVAFNLVDNTRNTKILTIKKTRSTLQTFKQILSQEATNKFETIFLNESNVKLEGHFSSKSFPNKSHQYIYFNNHFLPSNNELYKYVSDLFSASQFSVNKDQERITANGQHAGKGRFIQKYPIYIIKLSCDTWSSYDINVHLDMFAEFHDFKKVKAMLTKVTNQFLDQAGFLKGTIDKEPQRKRNKIEKTGKNTIDPYVAHSVSSNQSRLSEQTEEQRQPDYLTWWDPRRQTMFYIDPNTGNSFLTPPPPPLPSSFSSQSSVSTNSQRNVIDRSHLKRSRKVSNLDALFKNINNWPPRNLHLETSYKLSKQDLKDATVLNQVDNKFIAIQPRYPRILIMIDQHAADERIKLEEMVSIGIQSSTILEPGIAIQLDSPTEYEALQNDERILKCLKMWGIQIRIPSKLEDNINTPNNTTLSHSRFFDTNQASPHFHKSKVIITHLPQLIAERCILDHSILKSIIRDHMYWIKEQTDEFAIFNTCPRGILEMLKSRACRSAIMFNDTLDLEECSTIVKKLSNCNFPFQCAHGRPSAVPIQLETSPPASTIQRKVNWEKFKK
ncbi:hypothetical protein BD408DRAFT_447080 [Parasitella parasitica]|nr:hypothetical protein BD408DRAFT_447080 [Parasitella parasitica]